MDRNIAIRKSLLWTLCWAIALGVVLFFWLINVLLDQAEQQLSFIAPAHQLELNALGHEAESVFQAEGEAGLSKWLEEFSTKESTWAAMVSSDLEPRAGSDLSAQFKEGFRLGRDPSWKIHLYFEENPIIEVPFLDEQHHLLIQLPARMRPGRFLPFTHLLFQMVLPLLLALLISLWVYRHIMSPLRQLEKATRQFSDGQFDVRLSTRFRSNSNELSALARTFDSMADRTQKLIIAQRQLLADLSHELRTPLARMDMAISSAESGIRPQQAIARLHAESAMMRRLVEDALTLAWFNNEAPVLNGETIDLVALLRVIADDARYEFPDRILSVDLPDSAMLSDTSHRALGQAIENVLRNALKYTGPEGVVLLTLGAGKGMYRIRVQDQGPGVPESMLSSIFEPFFRVEKTVTVKNETAKKAVFTDGFGLGLALAQKHIQALGGRIRARNRYGEGRIIGLNVCILLPEGAVVEK